MLDKTVKHRPSLDGPKIVGRAAHGSPPWAASHEQTGQSVGALGRVRRSNAGARLWSGLPLRAHAPGPRRPRAGRQAPGETATETATAALLDFWLRRFGVIRPDPPWPADQEYRTPASAGSTYGKGSPRWKDGRSWPDASSRCIKARDLPVRASDIDLPGERIVLLDYLRTRASVLSDSAHCKVHWVPGDCLVMVSRKALRACPAIRAPCVEKPCVGVASQGAVAPSRWPPCHASATPSGREGQRKEEHGYYPV